MKARKILLIIGFLAAAAVSGSGSTLDGPSGDGSGDGSAGTSRPANGSDVVDFVGLANVEFGETEDELARRGMLDQQEPEPQEYGCAVTLAGMSTVSPIFDHDRLVLLWVDSPVHTPEGITIGTPINQVNASYPGAMRLTAPRGSYRLDGLLARDGDRAYLFLHDGRTVRKTIAGYADYARRLFDEGFGTC